MPNGMNTPNLGPFESESAIENPQSVAEAAAGSMSAILYRNRGFYVSCEFLIGTANLVTKEGILYDSGNNFLALYDETNDTYTVCDFFSLKFITFYPSRTNYLPVNEQIANRNSMNAPWTGNQQMNFSRGPNMR